MYLQNKHMHQNNNYRINKQKHVTLYYCKHTHSTAPYREPGYEENTHTHTYNNNNLQSEKTDGLSS